MPDNVLKGSIKIDAPGFRQVTEGIVADVGKVEKTLKPLAATAQKAMDGVAQAFSKITTVDFTKQIEDARQKVSDSIDKMANDALGLGDSFAKATPPAIKSLNDLRAAMDSIKGKIGTSTDIAEIQKLSIEFGALETKANALVSTFKNFSSLKIVSSAIPADLSARVQAFGGGVLTVNTNLNKLGQTVPGVVPKINQLNNVSNTAGQSILNFSRIAQDAPYGIIGIANNINPALEGLQRLSIAAKAAGVSMGTALRGALVGPAGIGLAVGVISSLLVVFGKELFGAGEAAKSTAEKTQEAKQALQEYIDALEDSRRASLLGAQDANNEITNLRLLYQATQDITLSQKERQKAVDALQKQYPTYFAQIKDEIILAGGAANEYFKLTGSILAAAKARAQLKIIDENADKILANNERLLDLDKEWFKAKDQLAKAQDRLNKAGGAGQGAVGFVRAIETAQARVNNLTAQRNVLIDENTKAATKNLDIEKQILSTVKQQGVETLIGTGTDLPKVKTPKVKIDKIEFDDFKEIKFTLPNATDSDELRERVIRSFNEIFKTALIVDPNIQLDISGINVLVNSDTVRRIGDRVGIGFGDAFAENFNRQIQAAFNEGKGLRGVDLENFSQKIGIGLKFQAEGVTALADAFGGFTDALFSGENAFKGFGQSLISSLKRIASELIKTIVLAGILSALTGGASAASGKGLSFLGAFKKILGFARGGIVPGTGNTDSVPAMLTPGEYIVTKEDTPKFLNFLKFLSGARGFETGGLVGRFQMPSLSLDKFIPRVTNVQNVGGFNIPESVELKIHGDNLVGILALSNKSQGRTF